MLITLIQIQERMRGNMFITVNNESKSLNHKEMISNINIESINQTQIKKKNFTA